MREECHGPCEEKLNFSGDFFHPTSAMSFPIKEISTKPFEGQKPGTSGLRKRCEIDLIDRICAEIINPRVKVFQQEAKSIVYIIAKKILTLNTDSALYGKFHSSHLRFHRAHRIDIRDRWGRTLLFTRNRANDPQDRFRERCSKIHHRPGLYLIYARCIQHHQEIQSGWWDLADG